MRYRINSPTVIRETIDGEVIIVHLATGAYYSLDDAGAQIWCAVEGGANPDAIAAAFAVPADGSGAAVRESVCRFVDELCREDLIVPCAGEEPSPGVSADCGVRPESPYSQPVLNKYRDMEELLLLDPIHEVDEAGWPSVQEDSRT